MFPIPQGSVPRLYAWHINTSDDEVRSIGWKLAYRLRRELEGLWVWSDGHLLVEHQYNAQQMLAALRRIWQLDETSFASVRSVSPHTGWQPDPIHIAEFVTFGLASTVEREIRLALNLQDTQIQNARIVRDYNLQAWNVGNRPAISVSVFSHLIYAHALQHYMASLADPEASIGLLVKDRTGSYKGEVVAIEGRLATLRENLLYRTTRPEMRELLSEAPDDAWVVKVKREYNRGYDYVSTALQLIVRNQDFKRLQINGQSALLALQIPPKQRSRMVESIARILRRRGWIGERVYSTSWSKGNFISPQTIDFPPQAKLGDQFVCDCDTRTILRALKTHPPYRVADAIEQSGYLRVGVINFIGDHPDIPTYLADIRDRLMECHFAVKFTSAQRPDSGSVYAIEQAVDQLCIDKPHILIALMPGSAADDDHDNSLYHRFKALVVGRDIPSQVIFESTLGNRYAIDNIVLGIMGKTGNSPYVLSKPLPYADIVVGIDIARGRTTRRSGSISMAAIARIYLANGDLLRYTLHDAPLEGEILPKPIIHRLLPARDFAGKRVIVHRDGPFRGYERQDLQAWGDEIGASFFLVEIIKSGTPRLYMAKNGSIEKPPQGTLFKLNDQEGFVVTTTAHKRSTPRPLTIRTDGSLSVEDAAHAVLSMTMLHYGSLRPPRLPVTIHYSDRIGYLALRGIKPKSLEGTTPFWL